MKLASANAEQWTSSSKLSSFHVRPVDLLL
jgi:hypothetical protein